jgi:error-prone DNA polymerase
LLDGARYLAWPTDRASYGRLASLLSRARIAAEKVTYKLRRADLPAHVKGLAVPVLPPALPDPGFVTRLAADARDLRDRLDLPLHLAAWCTLTARADEVRRPEPGSRRPVRLPSSRNFR